MMRAPTGPGGEARAKTRRAKLSPPVATLSMVERSGLDAWMRSAARANLVLLHAPAGFGKTTVMLQMAARFAERGRRSAWLTLDAADNDPGRFLAALLGALQGIDPGLDPAALDRASFEVESALLNILDWVSRYPEPFVLFLDDCEAVHNREIHGVFRQIVEELPPGQLFVAATRTVPDLGLGSFRVRGRLLEIGAGELRFGFEEADAFLRRRRGLSLDDDDLVRLHRNTEGWAAALQLAALALTGRDDGKAVIDSFSGSFCDIADYLAEEVFSRQSEEVRAFLLKTSVLERLSGPLCDAVVGGGDGYRMLSYLERANLFLMPLDEDRSWYRYHHVFSEFLRNRLERDFPGAQGKLHRLAADWYAQQGIADEAARHALWAGDLDRAAGLVASCAMRLVRLGRLRTVDEWVERLPAETVERHPELRIARCWTHAFRHRYAQAAALLEEISGGLDPERVAPDALDSLHALEPLVFSHTDRVEETLRLAQENLARCSQPRSFGYGILLLISGCHLLEAGRFEEAKRALWGGQQNHLQGESTLGSMYAESFLGASDLIQGRLGRALEQFRLAWTQVKRVLPGYSVVGAVASTFLADALYERDEVDEAQRLLTECKDLLPECLPLDVMILGYVTLARGHWARGEPARAAEVLAEAAVIGEDRGVPRLGATVRLEQVRFHLRRGEVDGAVRLSRSSDDRAAWRTPAGWSRLANDSETPQMGALRLMIRTGETRQALVSLKGELERAEASRRHRQALKLRLLLAEALAACDERKPALRVLREAVRFGFQEGYVRSFADEGAPLVALLRDLREACAASEGEGRGYLEYVDRLLASAGEESPGPARAADEPGASPSDLLTERELEVIRLMASGRSNRELADCLFVSVPTVKYHLRNINLKLNSANRTEAIAKAREFGLLS